MKIKSAVVVYVVIKVYRGKYSETIVQKYAIEKFYSQLMEKK